LRRHGKLRHRARHSDGVVDRGGNRRADAGDPALACPFDAEGIERACMVLAQDDLHLGELPRRRDEVIGKGGRQRVTAFIIGEFFQQRPTQALREATVDLSFHQGWIDGAADIVSNDIVLDLHAPGVAVDFHHREVHAVGIDLVLHPEPAFR